MSFQAYKNKNLLVPESVVLNPQLDIVLSHIDKYWPEASEKVTSGVRTAEDQLRIIRKYLKVKNLESTYPEALTCDVDDVVSFGEKKEYAWQRGWSALLASGVIINPPLAAECLMDYFRSGVNKKGKIIQPSPHTRGTAFDISGTDSLTIVKRLLEDAMIKGYLLERENNCIHIDI